MIESVLQIQCQRLPPIALMPRQSHCIRSAEVGADKFRVCKIARREAVRRGLDQEALQPGVSVLAGITPFTSSYFFFSLPSFLAISSTNLGLSSASTLSTMLAIAEGSAAAAGEDSPAAEGASGDGSATDSGW